MITKDEFWKRELVRVSERLALRRSQRRWTDASTAALERDVFVAAFAVRKLIESNCVSQGATGSGAVAVSYPRLSDTNLKDAVPHFSHHYDLGHGKRAMMAVRKLMDQFIHSYYFSAFVPFGSQMMGIFFSSDSERKERLWYITVPELAAVFDRVGRDVGRLK